MKLEGGGIGISGDCLKKGGEGSEVDESVDTRGGTRILEWRILTASLQETLTTMAWHRR